MIGYWFAPMDMKLGHGDGRPIEVGRTHKVDGGLKLCEHGLHASRRPIDALTYAPGPIACKVELGGTIIHGEDKMVASERIYLCVADATDVLRRFARLCALDAIHLWDAPDIVVRYLKTGDAPLRGWAAGEAARAAGEAARAARAAAGEAAWTAVGAAQNRRLAQMLSNLWRGK